MERMKERNIERKKRNIEINKYRKNERKKEKRKKEKKKHNGLFSFNLGNLFSSAQSNNCQKNRKMCILLLTLL